MRKNFLISSAVFLVLFTSAAIFARPGAGKGCFYKKGLETAGLSETQRESVRKLCDEMWQQKKKVWSEIGDLKENLASALDNGASDEELEGLLAQLREKKDELGKLREEHMTKIREMLTPRQRAMMVVNQGEHWQESRAEGSTDRKACKNKFKGSGKKACSSRQGSGSKKSCCRKKSERKPWTLENPSNSRKF